MSLTHPERAKTSAELHANLDLAGWAPSAIAEALDITGIRVAEALAVTAGADPADVWLVRDFLDEAVRVAGETPSPYSVLTDEARKTAREWFELRSPADVQTAVAQGLAASRPIASGSAASRPAAARPATGTSAVGTSAAGRPVSAG